MRLSWTLLFIWRSFGAHNNAIQLILAPDSYTARVFINITPAYICMDTALYHLYRTQFTPICIYSTRILFVRAHCWRINRSGSRRIRPPAPYGFPRGVYCRAARPKLPRVLFNFFRSRNFCNRLIYYALRSVRSARIEKYKVVGARLEIKKIPSQMKYSVSQNRGGHNPQFTINI